ncbi:MAG: uroporphyrinogen decarboxylase family protein [Candidatus Bathyarchaeia archaeon]
MSPKERFLETALFGKPDRVPLAVGDVRPLTLERWRREGLPQEKSVVEYFRLDLCGLKAMGFTSYPSQGFRWEPSPSALNLGPLPPFEYKLLSEDERYRIWVDSLGIIQKGFQEDWRHGWSGFATRVFLEFPVKDREDFQKMKLRYDAKDARRYPKGWQELVKTLRMHEGPLCLNLEGPFWWARNLMGLHNLLLNAYKNRDFLKEVFEFYTEFHLKTLLKALEEVEADYAVMSEDMAYKKGPMMSPWMVEEFLSQTYRDLTAFLKDHGVKVVFIDSDGNVEPLIPIWLRDGIDGITPCEIASGLDLLELRRRFPRLIMMGGLDKRELAKGKEAIEAEVLSKVPFLTRLGGYFPGVDHAVPPDVSLENFGYFLRVLKRVCGWEL